MMFATKLAITAALATAAGGATIYAVRADSPSTPAPTITTNAAAAVSAAAPTSKVRRSTSAADHAKLANAIAAARQRRLARGATQDAAPSLATQEFDYLQDAVGELTGMLGECLDRPEGTYPVDGKITVRCTVETEPDVGAIVRSSEVLEDGTTIHDAQVLECVRETIASVELDPAEIGGELTFDSVVQLQPVEVPVTR